MKKIKGFTLIELIIVMAVMSILLIGIMQMMKPIRGTFVDSTYYEAQRNTQNGVITYLSENLRYATNVGIYTSGTVGSAIDDFKNNVVDNTYAENEIHVITIDNKRDYTYNGATGFRGRVIVNKPTATGYDKTKADDPTSNSARVALSEAYYGDCSYSINITPVTSGIFPALKLESLDITVSSLLDHGSFGKSKKKNIDTNTEDIATSANQFVSTKGYVICGNMEFSRDDCGNYKQPSTVSTTTHDTKTYIVYTLPKL